MCLISVPNQVEDMEFRISDTLSGLDDNEALCYARTEILNVRPERITCTPGPITGRYIELRKLSCSTANCWFSMVELEAYE